MTNINVHNLSKSHDDIRAVQYPSLEVEGGELSGLVGPDGADKTATFRMPTTLILPDENSTTVEGSNIVRDYEQIRNCIGYMPGHLFSYRDLTVRENLEFFATVSGTTIKQNYSLTKDIYKRIEPFSNRRTGELLRSMKQKLALCCALIYKPKVLFLDEPIARVDVVSRKEFQQVSARLEMQGITVLVSTPYMDGASLYDHIALTQAGKVLSTNAPEQVITDYPATLYAVKTPNLYALLQHLCQGSEVDSCCPFGEYLHLTLRETASPYQFE